MYCKNEKDLNEELKKLDSGIALILAGEIDFNFETYQPYLSKAKSQLLALFFRVS